MTAKQIALCVATGVDNLCSLLQQYYSVSVSKVHISHNYLQGEGISLKNVKGVSSQFLHSVSVPGWMSDCHLSTGQ